MRTALKVGGDDRWNDGQSAARPRRDTADHRGADGKLPAACGALLDLDQYGRESGVAARLGSPGAVRVNSTEAPQDDPGRMAHDWGFL
jgi:hypothetical protein